MSYIGQQLPADVFSGFVTDSFTGDGSATTFTLSKAPFSEDALIVVINNVIQKPVTNFTVSGTTLTIVGTAVADGDVLYAIHTGGAIPITTPGDNSVTSAKLSGNLVTPGTLDVNGQELILDADADTSITADTDDQIDFKTGGTDRMHVVSSGHLSVGASSITNGGGYNKVIQVSGTEGCFSAISSSGEGIFAQNGANTQVVNRANGYMEFRTNNTVHQYITANGEVTKPLQPTASARPTSALSNVTGDGTLYYLGNSIGATERFDVGGCFSNDGMLFIAPVTGKYQLCGQVMFTGLASNHTLTYFMLATSNQTYYPFYGAEIDTVAYSGSFGTAFSIVADMDANDSAQLAVQVYGGSKVVDVSTSTFLTGMLLA